MALEQAVLEGRAAAVAAATMEAACIAAEWREASQGLQGAKEHVKRSGPTCAGCHQALRRPRLLRCLHIFCLSCLEGLAEFGGRDSLRVRCPACEMETPVGSNGQPHSLELINSDEGVLKIIAILAEQDVVGNGGGVGGGQQVSSRNSTCDNCLQASVAVWCDACDAALCVQCSAQIHGFRSISAARPHNPTRLQEGSRVPARLPTCQVHAGEKLLFLSISRQQLICRECVLVGGHERDRYVPVEEAGRQTRLDLVEVIQQVEGVERRVDRALEEAAMRNPTVIDIYRSRKQHLESRADELKAAMHDRKMAALEKVAEERDRKAQRVLVQGVGLGRVAVALEHAALLGQMLSSRGNDLEVLRASQGLERLLDAACGIAVDASIETPQLFSGAVTGASHDLAAAASHPPAFQHTSFMQSQESAREIPQIFIPHVPVPSTRSGATRNAFSHGAVSAGGKVGGWKSGGEAVIEADRDMGNGSAGNGASTTKNLLVLPEAILTPKGSQSNSHSNSPGISPAGGSITLWGARKESSNGTLQQVFKNLALHPWGAPKQGAAQSLYALGGFDGTINLASMEVFDACTHAWKEAPSMSCTRRGLAAAAFEGRIYVVGGWDGRKYLDSMAIFDTFTGNWTTGPPMLCSRCFAAATFVGPHLFVVGGYYGATNLRSAERFDPISSEWVTLPNMTSARRGLGTAAFKGHMLLAIGGWDGKMNLATVECLDVDKLFGWTLVAPLKVPRCSLSAVSSGDLVFVCGGWDGSDYLSSVECLSADGDGQEWRLLTRMNIPRSYCAAAVCTNRFVPLFRSLARSRVLSLSLSLLLSWPSSSIVSALTVLKK